MTRLILLAATAAALCWPAADETDAKPLFWLHAPKTGSSLREFLVDYSCGPNDERHRTQAAADLALTRRLRTFSVAAGGRGAAGVCQATGGPERADEDVARYLSLR